MEKKLFLCFSLLIILLSCKNTTKHNETTITTVNTLFICNLNENKEIISQIDDADFLNDSTFIVVSNKQIIKYSTSGDQMSIITHIGNAPHEYITPSLISVCDSSIFVWCSSSLKLIQYNTEGEFINAITDYRKAIKNFAVYNNEFVFFYKNDGTKEGIIDVYDIKKKQITASVGNYSDEDLLLLMMKFTPEIIIRDNYAYFIRPSNLNIYRFNANDFKLETFAEIKDKEYSISKVDNAKNIINTQREKAFEYIYKNSLTDNLFHVDNGLIVKSEIGEYVIDERKKEINRSYRFNKFYLWNDGQLNNVWKTTVSPCHYTYINYKDSVFVIQNTLYNEVVPNKLFKIIFTNEIS